MTTNWYSVKSDIDYYSKDHVCNVDVLKGFCELNGFTKLTGVTRHYNPLKVLQTGKMTFTFDIFEVPYLDHARYFKNTKTGVCCLVYHPYQKVSSIQNIVGEWAYCRGMKAEFYDYSWYYPGRCCCVIISLPGTVIETEFPDLKKEGD